MSVHDLVVRVLITEYDRPLSIFPLSPDNRMPINRMSCLIKLYPHWIQPSLGRDGGLFINQVSLSEYLQRNGYMYGLTTPSFNCQIIEDQPFTDCDLHEFSQMATRN